MSLSHLLLGATLNMFEVTSLGQPLEVIKTTMAAHRTDSFPAAMRRVWARGVYQGLIPWAWIEASSKGAVLLFVASEAEYHAKRLGAADVFAGMAGGMVGGVAQAYATVGFCTCMKTAEITRSKLVSAGVKPPSTLEMFHTIYQTEGMRGINKGVNAVAIRQVTNWGSRFGLSRLAEDVIRRGAGKEDGQPLNAFEKVLASSVGGGLSAWNQPVEVIRVELQSMKKDPSRPSNLTIASAARYIYRESGIRGLYRGATPRIGLGIWQTVCMVALGDMAKDGIERITGSRAAGH
ncbi:mitochondrial carrier domain-containing protein [Aspergillus aurantiobrunneus]